MVVVEDGKAENYEEVLETSKLRPDVEPFVPKAVPATPGVVAGPGSAAAPQPYIMINNPGFSLDAPEFVPSMYLGDGSMYTWVPGPSQFIMPSTTHPRFLIPRFRDKFLRQQQRSRTYNGQVNGIQYPSHANQPLPPPQQQQQQHHHHRNSSNTTNNTYHHGNGESHYHSGSNNHYNTTSNTTISNQSNSSQQHHHHHHHQQNHHHKPYKIEQRSDRKHQDRKTTAPNNTSQINKPVQLEKKTVIRSKKDRAADKHNSPLPVPVVDIVEDSNTMSYRMALVGSISNSSSATNSTSNVNSATNSTSNSNSATNSTSNVNSDTTNNICSNNNNVNSGTSNDKPEIVQENKGDASYPSEEAKLECSTSNGKHPSHSSEYTNGGEPYYRGRGRPKPTKGSGIQLNIFSLVQDKKAKKKKGSKNPPKKASPVKVTGNALDATAPEIRRGKEREDGKPKKLSKMKKIIDKEKTEGDVEDVTQGSFIREYCHQAITPELNSSLKEFLSRLREFNDRAYKHGSTHKRRYCCGLREAAKYLRLNKVKCIVIPPNIDKVISKGGLDECVDNIQTLSLQQNVPIFFGLNKTFISKILARPKSTITSAVSVFSYQGAEALYKQVEINAALAKERYMEQLQQRSETLYDPEERTPETPAEEEASSEGEEFEEDNNEEEDTLAEGDSPPQGEEHLEDEDDASVSSSFVDSGIENNEVSSLSIDNGHTSGEG